MRILKKKNGVIFIMVILGYLALFGLSFKLYRETKSENLLRGEVVYPQEGLVGMTFSGSQAAQLLTINEDKEIAGIAFQVNGESGVEGYLLTQIVDPETGEVLHSSETPLGEFAGREYYPFVFDEAKELKKLKVSFELIIEGDNTISISRNLSVTENKLYVNDTLVKGVLSFLLLYPSAPPTLASYALFYFALTLPIVLFLGFKWNPWTSIWGKRAKVGWIDILLLALVLVFSYVSFNHADLVATMDHGKDLLIAVGNGDLIKFYQYGQRDPYVPVPARYLLPTYIFFALWNIPISALFKIAGLPFETASIWYGTSLKILWWNKLLPVLFFFATAVVIYRIGLELKLPKEKAKWMVFLWVSFPIAIYSQFIFGQYDSFCLFFTLVGFLYYLRKDLTRFTIFMAIAMTFKTIPLFLFIPLLLYAEKRVLHVLKYVVIVISGVVFFNVLFLNDPFYVQAAKFSTRWVEYMFFTGIDTKMGEISLFPAAIAALSIYLYAKPEDHSEEFNRNSAYIALAAYSLFFAFSNWHAQWVIHLTPFLVITAFLFNRFQLSMFIDTGLSILFFGITVLTYPGLDGGLLKEGIFPRILNWNSFGTVGDVFTLSGRLPDNTYNTLFVALLLINLVIKFPTSKHMVKAPDQPVEYLDKQIGCEDDGNNVERDVIWVRLLSVMIFIAPVLLLYMFQN